MSWDSSTRRSRIGARNVFTLSVTYFFNVPLPPLPISSAISTSPRPVHSDAVVISADTPGRLSGSNVMKRSESVWLFLMSFAVSSAVADRLMALP